MQTVVIWTIHTVKKDDFFLYLGQILGNDSICCSVRIS